MSIGVVLYKVEHVCFSDVMWHDYPIELVINRIETKFDFRCTKWISTSYRITYMNKLKCPNVRLITLVHRELYTIVLCIIISIQSDVCVFVVIKLYYGSFASKNEHVQLRSKRQLTHSLRRSAYPHQPFVDFNNAMFTRDTFTWGKLTVLLYCATFSIVKCIYLT